MGYGDWLGTAETVAELREILDTLPPETKVRTRSLSHTWPVDVKDLGDGTVLFTFDR